MANSSPDEARRSIVKPFCSIPRGVLALHFAQLLLKVPEVRLIEGGQNLVD